MSRHEDRDREDRDADVVEALTDEARAHWVPRAPDVEDATDAERRLFARIDAHQAEAGRRTSAGGTASFWGPVALITAVAAGVLLFSHPRGEGVASDTGPSRDVSPTTASSTAASPTPTLPPTPPRPTAPAALAALTEGGELRVDGVKADSASLRDGESLETRGGVAAFSAPGRVEWLLENGTEVTAVRAGTHGGAIVLGLRQGAVEAQVTPVPGGEAFAVDVEGVRVAVHGTHLRVARSERGGSWVVVDLSEGVISVGAPPKAGSTIGVVVNAPAHVEFSAADLDGTLRVDRDPTHVRSPVDPTMVARAVELPEHASEPAPDVPVAASPRSASYLASQPGSASRGAIAAMATPETPPVQPTALERFATAVRTCAEQKTHGGTATVTIRSTMTFEVKEDGFPKLTTFDPPLVPDLQACVANAAYGIQWSGPGPLRIPIELRR
jgi:hypothetical protein